MLQDSEFEAVYDYLKKHLQGEIGRWSESEVKIQELYWRMEQNEGGQGQSDHTDHHEGGQDDSGNPIDYGSSTGSQSVINEPTHADLQKKKEETLHLVSGLTDQHVRQFVKNMIVNEDSYIIDTILKYVRRV